MMKDQNTEWDRKLRDRLENQDHPTTVNWGQVEDRIVKLRKRNRIVVWTRRVAASLLVIIAGYVAFILTSEPSWEYTPVASVTSLDDTESGFFSASELHYIYSQGK